MEIYEMNESLISVIVPIFKVEDYLNRCVESLIAQTYHNLEIILVDDGSTDTCPQLCDEWAEKDKRIKVIHKKNGGLSDARNAGIRAAEGEYILFVDSDDWVCADYAESLYRAVESSNSDICECDVIRTSGEIMPHYEGKECIPVCYEPEEALKLLIEDRIFHQHVWNKIYRCDCIQGIPFEKGMVNEDEFWTYQIFGRANKVSKIQKKLYYYFQRNNSIMGTEYNYKRLDVLEAKNRRQRYIEKNYPRLGPTARINLLQTCMYSGQMVILHMKGEECDRALQSVTAYFKEEAKESKKMPVSLKEKFWFGAAKINFRLVCRIRNRLKIGF